MCIRDRFYTQVEKHNDAAKAAAAAGFATAEQAAEIAKWPEVMPSSCLLYTSRCV